MESQATQYGLAKRLMTALPGSREALAAAYMRLPTPVSSLAYNAARRIVFRDNQRRLPVLAAAFDAVRQAGAIGDYLEFGVARGTSMISAMKLARARAGFGEMRFHAFDSFAGLPAGEGGFAAGDMAYDEGVFRRFLAKAGGSADRLTVTKGFFDTSLTPDRAEELGIVPGRAHIVHVDCDLYASTRPVLDFVAPLLGPGSVIIFDDWFSFESEAAPWDHGEQRAFREWALREDFEPIAITYGWNAAWKRVRRT